ncbi:hypothetical protein [Cytobacillus firmus]|uniref:hypothetical protein n=1 Tax=Cytobacillus firmus TaxID=1399 RepID=UPI001C8F0F5B|nr:hypothetical protein [Cytobacillus firmus]MBX9972534.1 hypothetical protein [Cytobacillus firmus]
MLNFFEDIILPAFQKGIIYKNKRNGNDYLFENVELSNKNGIFVLVGLLVKKTHLDIKSRYDENGKLTKTNYRILSDPYSYFIINLQNHRMALVKNQKGSPTVSDFENTAAYILKTYVNEYNNDINDKDSKLPKPNLNVVSMPTPGKIEDEISKVKKIESAVLRFYPLNGDIPPDGVFNELRHMLTEVESKSGNTQINNPKNHRQMGELLKDTKGTVRPTLRVIYSNGAKRTLREKDFSEKTEIELDDDMEFHENIDDISGKVINERDYNDTSDENKRIYEKFFSRLESLFNLK